MIMRRGLLGLVLLLVLTAGCSQRHDDEENLAIFKYNESAGILTLDPIYAKDLPHIWACNQVFNSLVAFDDKMNLCHSNKMLYFCTLKIKRKESDEKRHSP